MVTVCTLNIKNLIYGGPWVNVGDLWVNTGIPFVFVSIDHPLCSVQVSFGVELRVNAGGLWVSMGKV